MFTKILIANRGEIAVRIMKTCARLGIRTVAVYSEIDARSLHVQCADEAFLLGPARASESYLVKEKLIDIAKSSGAQAVHPGYGFLSENADFARMVAEAGLVFIGPPAEAIVKLGDKIASKVLAEKAGVSVVPGRIGAVRDADEAIAIANEIGFPVLLKPAAGGGGKGMRIVFEPEQMAPALQSCIQETRKAFDDNQIFIERYIEKPRHIEMQIFADRYGNVVHIGERECSIQRRYQKIIEESPSVAVSEELRERMGQMACSLAREAGYTNAGTVEFIMDPDGAVYFLEMNTRLQVEHPVTEMVSGLDLVELQLKIAYGEPLPLQQADIKLTGHAIEARICAEDPGRNFLPATGMITRYAAPRGRNARVDSGVEAGSLVGVYYDSLLAKVICWGTNREEACNTLVDALNGYHIEGVTTNVDFVNRILTHPEFVAGNLTTGFISQHFEGDRARLPANDDCLRRMAAVAALLYDARQRSVRESLKPMAAHVGPGIKPKIWNEYRTKSGDDSFPVRVQGNTETRNWIVWVEDHPYQIVTPEFEFYRRRIRLSINGRKQRFRLQFDGSHLTRVAFCGILREFEIYSPKEWALTRFMPKPETKSKDNAMVCPMPGLVVDVLVKPGDRVYKGQELVIVESMKMESGVASPCDGEVLNVMVEKGNPVDTGDILITFVK
ncbi:acetyl/propionyl/methylcrotonyl-CoA carboxylase subunit alpha [Desulfatirhabdium butyrativorans]|uniref:acetyl/propionyl/methylcrotonyl-CoA carboxylase subunit alpha n=1 Tax=Desulfatirhabdium butyrativorans TaxID=340467 RepID=UPI000426B4A5|nr:acetyl/propionyl/methylcrotonyl-CoA carboxylase subunit alpha [Desulfatirhabdium butyrativorans]